MGKTTRLKRSVLFKSFVKCDREQEFSTYFKSVCSFSQCPYFHKIQIHKVPAGLLWTQGSFLLYRTFVNTWDWRTQQSETPEVSSPLTLRYTGRSGRTRTWLRTRCSAWPSWPPCMGPSSPTRAPRSHTWRTSWRACWAWSTGRCYHTSNSSNSRLLGEKKDTF